MSQKGIRIHGNILAASGTASAAVPVAHCSKIIERKYAALFYRYYFFARIHHLRYDEILIHLEQEFFIGDSRIAGLLKERGDQLRAIIEERPTLAQLAEKYPMYSWPKPNKTDIFKASKKHG